MISNEKIKTIIEECKRNKHVINVRDIAYSILCMSFEDINVAYKCIFGGDLDFSQEYCHEYDSMESIKYLKQYMEYVLPAVKMAESRGGFTFEQNKAYMLELKKMTEKAMEANEIEKKDALKILSDISVKLNDKFQVKDEVKDQTVHVNQKYDDICPRCHTEIARRPITKEEAMSMYNLIERQTV